MPQKSQVIIIGAGAAGLMCAATAAIRGREVMVLDHANKIAKKVLMSGGGRCNFTNRYTEPSNFISNNLHFCKSALSRFNQWDFIALVEKYKIPYFEKSLGQLFCQSSSKSIRDLLFEECQARKVKIQLKCEIKEIKSLVDGGFSLSTNLGDYHCESLVIASGGLSIPSMGASGFGYDVARQFGHKIITTRPGLTPLTFSGKQLQEFKSLAGNSLNVQVSCNDQTFNEAMLFTHKGLSGPAILQISNYWEKGQPIVINLLPNLNVAQWLQENINERPEINLKTLLATCFSQAIAGYLVDKIDAHCKLKQIDHKQLKLIINLLQQWAVYPSDVEGYRVAEVTLGGVDSEQISSKTFESKNQKDLYFIGEVLDVTGHLGGHNFQWAWASGYAAGSYV